MSSIPHHRWEWYVQILVKYIYIFQGDRSATPLYYAACQNNTEMISLLLSYGARLDMYMTYQEVRFEDYH